MSDPKSECEGLLGAAVPFARQMLEEHREFYPFAVVLTAEGEISQVGAATEDEQPESREVMALLEDVLRNDAATGELRATAIAYDVMIEPPGKETPQDAIAVALDHKEDYSVVVVFPYSFAEDGTLNLEDPFAMDGERRIFAA